ncbi:MAG: hypothetical protein M3463_08735 [Verrucomicrobiota bacterium]|nr:hypothetical protein [Verrucomicrobiota bacterium]
MFELIAVLTVAGFLLLIVEVFIPGAVVGICGVLSLLAAVVLCYTHYGPTIGSQLLTGVLLGGIVLTILWFLYLPRSRFIRTWSLHAHIESAAAQSSWTVSVGEAGRALTDLRPAGTAEFSARRRDVVAESGFIEAGAPIEVIRVDAFQIVVRPVRA